MPEDAKPALVVFDPVYGGDGPIDAEELVGFDELLDETEFTFLEGDKILDDVEKPRGPAGAFNQRVQTDDTRLVLVVHPLPFVEEFERRLRAAEDRIDAVRQDDEGVGHEDMRDSRTVIAEVAVIRV